MKKFLLNKMNDAFVFIMLAIAGALFIGSPNLRAEEVTVGGISYQSGYFLVYNCYQDFSGEYLYTADDIGDAGGASGMITSIAFRFSGMNGSNATGVTTGASVDYGPDLDFKIKMMNMPATLTSFLATSGYPDANYTTVFAHSSWNMSKQHLAQFGTSAQYAAGEYVVFELSEPFEYTGEALVVKVCSERSSYTCNNYNNFYGEITSPYKGHTWWSDVSGGNACGDAHSFTSTTVGFRPHAQFNIEMLDHTVYPEFYAGAKVNQSTGKVLPAATNVPIISTAIKVNGDLPPNQKVDQFVFNAKGSTNKLSRVALYYTAKNRSFDAPSATLLGEISGAALAAVGDNLTFNFSPITFPDHGTYVFWVVYDVSRAALHGQLLDAKLTSFHMFTNEGTTVIDPTTITTPDPNGAITVVTSDLVHCGLAEGAVPAGNSYSTGWPGYNYYNVAMQAFQYQKEELNGLGGMINRVDWYVAYYGNSNSPRRDSVYILMRNNTTTPTYIIDDAMLPPGSGSASGTVAIPYYKNYLNYLVEHGFKIVKGPFSYPNVGSNQWINVTFDDAFEYDGNNLDVITVRFSLSQSYYYADYSSYTYWNYWYPVTYGNGEYGYSYNSATPVADLTGTWYSYPYPGYHPTGSVKPCARFDIDYMPGQKYKASAAFHTDKAFAGSGATNVEILGYAIEIAGRDEDPYMFGKTFVFDGKMSYDSRQITRARLFYTKDSAFSTGTQLGSDVIITADNIHNITFDLPTPFRMSKGKNYFWLSYQIETNESISDGKYIDASFKSAVLLKIDEFFKDTIKTNLLAIDVSTPDPKGEKQILAPMRAGTYYVGTGTSPDPAHTYPTLSALAKAFSEVGVAIDTKVFVLSSIIDSARAIFGPSPFGDNIHVTIAPYTGVKNAVITNNKQDKTYATLVLSGLKHLTINGSNGAANSVGDLSFAKTGEGIVVSAVATDDITFNGVKFTGSDTKSNIVDINGTAGIAVLNCEFTKGGIGLNITNNSSAITLENNTFGSPTSTPVNALSNGLAILNGSNNAMIRNNKFFNIMNSEGGAYAIKIQGNSAYSPLNINLYGNYVRNVSSYKDISSAFEIDNATDVSLYHNTVYLTKPSGQIYTAALYNRYSNSTRVNMRNNIFVNTLTYSLSGYYPGYIITPSPTTICGDVDYNIYNGINNFQTGYNGTTFNSFENWKSQTGKDKNSHQTQYVVTFISDSDVHLDGEIVGTKELLVPVMSEVKTDIDGLTRGLDTYFPNMTTPGVDEVMMKIRANEETKDLPPHIIQCEDAKESILIAVGREFDGWLDGVARNTTILGTNIWINEKNDTLTLENGGYRTDYYPYLHIKAPDYLQSCSLKAFTKLGYYVNESSWCKLDIVKLPEFLDQPLDEIACVDAGVVSAFANIYGSYSGLQWERLVGSNWVGVTGQTSDTLRVSYEPTVDGASKIAGRYRLRIDPYAGMCEAEPAYYSNPINLSIGYPLTAVNLHTSVPKEALIDGICEGERMWLSVSVPDNAGTITGYQWQRYDDILNEYVAIPSVSNPTAITDTFVIKMVTPSDKGKYRCLVLGVAECKQGSSIISDFAEVTIHPTSLVVGQPSDLNTCIGSSLENALETFVTEPISATFRNQYQWFKNGTPFYRTNDNGTAVTPSDAVYKFRRTDTTFLPFGAITTDDAGYYTLRVIYANCQGDIDTMFSNEVNLFIYDKPQIISQTATKVFTMRGGVATFKVSAVNSGSDDDNHISYQWYRHYSSGNEVALEDGARVVGAKSPILIMTPIQESDINSTNDYYFCVLTGLCGSITSAPIKMELVPEIVIVQHPEDVSTCEGYAAQFVVTAVPSSADEPIGYQWYKDGKELNDGGNISGAYTSLLTVNPTISENAGSYYCRVYYTELGAAINSNIATLTLEGAPVIISVPDSVVVLEDDPIMLTVEIEELPGASYTYQWYFEGGELSNTNEKTYYVAKAKKTDEGLYTVKITSDKGCGEINSKPIKVTVGTGIIDQPDANFRIVSVTPNPITNEATVNYILPQAQSVKISLIDITGQLVADLFSGIGNEGANTFTFSDRISGLSNGTYIVILESNKKQAAHHITISK